MTRANLMAVGIVCLLAGHGVAGPGEYLKKPDAWFQSEEAKQIAANILSHQSDLGGWPKNISTTAKPDSGNRSDLKPTFDNGATTDELRFLARIHMVTRNVEYRKAFERGFDYILTAQYANGGWPQFHPPGNGYHRHITFNDNAMVRLMLFLRETATQDGYTFLDGDRRRRAQAAFDNGITCIIACQVRVNGKLTAWCAQHDEIDFRPRSARTYELATLSGAESVGITRLLMSLEKPSPEVVRAVHAAAAWFESAKVTGLRTTIVKDDKAPKGTNKLMVKDPSAPPLWARFYSIDSNKPVFSDRDGVPKTDLAEIGYERRNGYAWYGTWPQKLLAEEYPAWRAKYEAK